MRIYYVYIMDIDVDRFKDFEFWSDKINLTEKLEISSGPKNLIEWPCK